MASSVSGPALSSGLLGRDAQVGLAGGDLLANLRRIALVDDDLHVRVAALERGHRLRQRVTRLRVRGGDGECAELFAGEFRAGALQVGRVH